MNDAIKVAELVAGRGRSQYLVTDVRCWVLSVPPPYILVYTKEV